MSQFRIPDPIGTTSVNIMEHRVISSEAGIAYGIDAVGRIGLERIATA